MAASEPMPMPIPEPTPVSQPFWDGLAQHRILVQYSPSAGRYVFYPRTLAPAPWPTTWVARDRRRRNAVHLHRRAPAHRAAVADALPQLPAVVQWDAGPRFSTELVDVEPEEIRIGMRLEPVFCDVATAGITLLRYRPAR